MPPKPPAFWQKKNAFSTLLLPAAALYGLAASARNALATPVRMPVPVICVGNLTVGGAGKTPVALLLADMVRSMGKTPFFLSRGYGGQLAGPLLVDAARHTSAQVGDEPLLLAAQADTVISADRVAGARFAVAEGAEVIIMDDGMQNPHLHKDFSLLVVDGADFGNGRLLPAGPLREPVAEGLKRAGAVLAVNGTLAVQNVPLLHAMLVPMAAPELAGQKVVAFAGIGRPEKFRATLIQLRCDIIAFETFADHHPYREAELAALGRKAEQAGAMLVTTAKDAVRLPPEWQARVTVVRVQMVISEAEQMEAMIRGVMHAS